MGTRYKKDESLIDLDLVEKVEGGSNIKIYKLTDFGKEIVENMRK